MRRLNALRYENPTALIKSPSPHLGWVFAFSVLIAVSFDMRLSAEPNQVAGIQRECNAIEQQLSRWKALRLSKECDGAICTERTYYIDPKGGIRKIVERGSPSGDFAINPQEVDSYFDERMKPLLQITTVGTDPSHLQLEQRCYFANRQLIAIHKKQAWKTSSKPRDLWIMPGNPELAAEENQEPMVRALDRANSSLRTLRQQWSTSDKPGSHKAEDIHGLDWTIHRIEQAIIWRKNNQGW